MTGRRRTFFGEIASVAVMPAGPMQPNGPYSPSYMGQIRRMVSSQLPSTTITPYIPVYGKKWDSTGMTSISLLAEEDGLLIVNPFAEVWHNTTVLWSVSRAAMHAAEYVAENEGIVACTDFEPTGPFRETAGAGGVPVAEQMDPWEELQERMRRFAEIPVRFMNGSHNYASAFTTG